MKKVDSIKLLTFQYMGNLPNYLGKIIKTNKNNCFKHTRKKFPKQRDQRTAPPIGKFVIIAQF